jgi:hypothetical protein
MDYLDGCSRLMIKNEQGFVIMKRAYGMNQSKKIATPDLRGMPDVARISECI